MEWPLPSYGDEFYCAPEVRYEWSSIDIEDCRPNSFKGTQSLSMLSSFDPPTTRRRSSTATTQSYGLQPPSTPGSLGSIPSPSFISEPISVRRPSTEDHPGPPSPPGGQGQRHDVPNLLTSSYESELPEFPAHQSPRLSYPRRNTKVDQVGDLTDSCSSKCKKPCCSRRPSREKSDEIGTFKCEWKGCRYDRTFSRKGVLMRHIEMQHVNPKSFKCPWCSHATSRRENIRAHRRSIHKEVL